MCMCVHFVFKKKIPTNFLYPLSNVCTSVNRKEILFRQLARHFYLKLLNQNWMNKTSLRGKIHKKPRKNTDQIKSKIKQKETYLGSWIKETTALFYCIAVNTVCICMCRSICACVYVSISIKTKVTSSNVGVVEHVLSRKALKLYLSFYNVEN